MEVRKKEEEEEEKKKAKKELMVITFVGGCGVERGDSNWPFFVIQSAAIARIKLDGQSGWQRISTR